MIGLNQTMTAFRQGKNAREIVEACWRAFCEHFPGLAAPGDMLARFAFLAGYSAGLLVEFPPHALELRQVLREAFEIEMALAMREIRKADGLNNVGFGGG